MTSAHWRLPSATCVHWLCEIGEYVCHSWIREMGPGQSHTNSTEKHEPFTRQFSSTEMEIVRLVTLQAPGRLGAGGAGDFFQGVLSTFGNQIWHQDCDMSLTKEYRCQNYKLNLYLTCLIEILNRKARTRILLWFNFSGSTVVYRFVLSTRNQRIPSSSPTECVCP